MRDAQRRPRRLRDKSADADVRTRTIRRHRCPRAPGDPHSHIGVHHRHMAASCGRSRRPRVGSARAARRRGGDASLGADARRARREPRSWRRALGLRERRRAASELRRARARARGKRRSCGRGRRRFRLRRSAHGFVGALRLSSKPPSVALYRSAPSGGSGGQDGRARARRVASGRAGGQEGGRDLRRGLWRAKDARARLCLRRQGGGWTRTAPSSTRGAAFFMPWRRLALRCPSAGPGLTSLALSAPLRCGATTRTLEGVETEAACVVRCAIRT